MKAIGKSEGLSLAALDGGSSADNAPKSLGDLAHLLQPKREDSSVRCSARVAAKLQVATIRLGLTKGDIADAAIEQYIDKRIPDVNEAVISLYGIGRTQERPKKRRQRKRGVVS